MTGSQEHSSLTAEHHEIAAHVKQLHDLLLHDPQKASVDTVLKVLSEPLSFLGLETSGFPWSGPVATSGGRIYMLQHVLAHHIDFILDHVVLDWLAALPTTVQSSCFYVYFAPSSSNSVPENSNAEILGCVHFVAIQSLIGRLNRSNFFRNHSFVNTTILQLLQANVSSVSLLTRWRAVVAWRLPGGDLVNDDWCKRAPLLMRDWQELISRLYSIPARVANAVGQNFTDVFDNLRDHIFYERQSKFIIDAVELSQSSDTLAAQVLAVAISKLIVLGQTDVFMEMLHAKMLHPTRGFIGDEKTMAVWKNSLCHCSTKTLSTILVSAIRHLQRSALEITDETEQLWHVQQCSTFLNRIGYGPESTFGNAVVEDALTFGKAYETLVVRILICLQSGWPNHEGSCDDILAKSFKRALSIWSDVQFVRNSLPEYQRYIVEQMLLIVGYIGSKVLSEDGTEATFWSGMPEWLGLTNFSRKKLSLVLAEEVSKVVFATGKPVDFELDSADPDICLLRSLVLLRDGQRPAVGPLPWRQHVSEEGSESSQRAVQLLHPTASAIVDMHVDENSDEEVDPDAVVDQFARLETSDNTKHSGLLRSHKDITSGCNTESREENDLKPYAMDEEPDPDEELGSFPKAKVNPPIYLRDLNLYLRSSEDREKTEVGLVAAEGLVRRKAGSLELEEYAERIATTLITLQDSFDLPKFTEMREAALVALCVCSPLIVVRLLTKEFYEKHLSLGQRLTILSALSIGAQELSGRNIILETRSTTPLAQMQRSERPSSSPKPATTMEASASGSTVPPPSMELIRSAITLSQTRRFSQKSATEARRQPPKTNPFSKLAPIFVGGLLGRWGGNRGAGAEQGYDVFRRSPLVLLERFVAAAGIFVYFGGNSPSLIAMTRELFRFLLALRFYVPTASQLSTLPHMVQGSSKTALLRQRPLRSGKSSLADDQFGTMFSELNSSSPIPSSIVQLPQDGSSLRAPTGETGSRLHVLQSVSSSHGVRPLSSSISQSGVPGSQLSPGLVQTILFNLLILMNPPPSTLSDEVLIIEFGQDLAETQEWASELWEYPLDGEEKTRMYTANVLQRCHELQQRFME